METATVGVMDGQKVVLKEKFCDQFHRDYWVRELTIKNPNSGVGAKETIFVELEDETGRPVWGRHDNTVFPLNWFNLIPAKKAV